MRFNMRTERLNKYSVQSLGSSCDFSVMYLSRSSKELCHAKIVSMHDRTEREQVHFQFHVAIEQDYYLDPR